MAGAGRERGVRDAGAGQAAARRGTDAGPAAFRVWPAVRPARNRAAPYLRHLPHGKRPLSQLYQLGTLWLPATAWASELLRAWFGSAIPLGAHGHTGVCPGNRRADVPIGHWHRAA